MKSPSPERRLERRFAMWLLLGVAFVVALAEGVLGQRRAAVHGATVDWSALTDATAMEFTPDGLPLFRPGAVLGEVRFNALGLRGPEVVMPKPERTIRIAFLGDSRILAPELALASTLPELTQERLQLAHPNCRFDYLSLSGPSYHPAILADLWTRSAAQTDPDLAILMIGSIQQMLRAYDAGAPPQHRLLSVTAGGFSAEARHPQGVDTGIADLTLFATLRRILILSMPVLRPRDRLTLPMPTLGQAFAQMMLPLVSAMADTPVTAVAYRTRLRADADLSVQRRDARQLRIDVQGLSLDGALALSDFVVDQMAAVAATQGWDYIDPLPPLAENASHFRDQFHFTEKGHAHIATQLATRIGTKVTEDCKLR